MDVVDRYRKRRHDRMTLHTDYSPDQPREENGRFGEVPDSEKVEKQKEPAYAKGLREVEDSIRSDKVESLAAVDKDGNKLFITSDGQTGQCTCTAEQTKMMRDAIVTHNHPGGSTFSHYDIHTAFMSGAREMRACHRFGDYSIRRNFEIGDRIPEHYSSFAQDYLSAEKKYCRDVVDAIYNKTGDADRCNRMVDDYRREWLKNNSESYGWTYKERRR